MYRSYFNPQVPFLIRFYASLAYALSSYGEAKAEGTGFEPVRDFSR